MTKCANPFLFASLSALALAMGCGGPAEEKPEQRDPNSKPQNELSEEEQKSLADEIADDVVGPYALRITTLTVQKAIIGDQNVTSKMTSAAEIVREGDKFFFLETPCHAEATGAAVQTIVPDAVPRSKGTLRNELVFRKEGKTIAFDLPESTVVVGARLDNPSEDELPGDADDDRVLDTDNDGKPGVTIHVRGFPEGDIYCVQRTRLTLHGKRDFAEHFSGAVFDRSDQTVIGSSNPLLDQNTPSEPQNDSPKNQFEMKRIDAPLACDALVEQADSILR